MTRRKNAPGPGRKAGRNWDGSGSYEKNIRTGIMLTPAHHRWLKAQPGLRSVSTTIRRLIQDAITKQENES